MNHHSYSKTNRVWHTEFILCAETDLSYSFRWEFVNNKNHAYSNATNATIY